MNDSFSPLVTIVIPVFNGEKYLQEAIDSALSQTYQNVEIIVVNDGSTDSTEEILKGYCSRVRYFRKDNGGVASALNFAIRQATGSYISWLSHDDLYVPEKIAEQVDLLRQLDEAAREETIVWSNFTTINEFGEEMNQYRFQEEHPREKLTLPLYPILRGLIHGCTLLVPTRLYAHYNGFDEQLKVTQDYDLWFRMFRTQSLLFSETQSVLYRKHAEQGSKNIDPEYRELNDFWIRMLRSLGKRDMQLMADSVVEFYEQTLIALKRARFSRTRKYVKWKLVLHLLVNPARAYEKVVKRK